MSDNPFSTNDNPFEAPVATSGIVAAVESEGGERFLLTECLWTLSTDN